MCSNGAKVHFFNDAFYDASTTSNFGLPYVQLNQKPTPFALRVWKTAHPRICADGGANSIYDSFSEEDRKKYYPHYICGDMDSIRADVRSYFEKLGSQVISESKDQDSNDLEKCLNLIRRLYSEKACASCQGEHEFVLIDGALGGRIDHLITNLNTLLKYSDMKIVLTSSSCVCFVLPPGAHLIRRNPAHETRTCGIMSLFQSSSNIRSRGLRWELNGLELGFGKIISGSNEFSEASADEVHLETDVPLLWSNVLVHD